MSGGEEGARFGPSIMPGRIRTRRGRASSDVLEAIAAKTEAGPCVTHVGPDGAGHFVKMVHNGIEYGDMQLIAETYDVLHRGLGLTTPEAGEVFDGVEPRPARVVPRRADGARLPASSIPRPSSRSSTSSRTRRARRARASGRRRSALDLAVAIPTIGAALDARVLSSLKEQRVAASALYKAAARSRRRSRPPAPTRGRTTCATRCYAARVCSYAQGMALIAAGSAEYGWNIDLRRWRASGRAAASSARGCSIRAPGVHGAIRRCRTCWSIPRSPRDLQRAAPGWRRVVAAAAVERDRRAGARARSLAYFDSYRTARLPQNLTQAQRDAFGAHKFERVERSGFVHADWQIDHEARRTMSYLNLSAFSSTARG